MTETNLWVDQDLFQFAYMPNWQGYLAELARMAYPEPWRYKTSDLMRTKEGPIILERYINSVHRGLAIDYQNATTQETRDAVFFVREEFACYHTGLHDRRFSKPIYGFYARNKHEGISNEWVFKGFMTDTGMQMRAVNPLPLAPFWYLKQDVAMYFADYPVRVNLEHILLTPHCYERIPEELKGFRNLPLLLQTAVEFAKQQASCTAGIVVPQIYNGQVQFMLPLSLADSAVTDLVLTLTPMDGYYMGSTCLTPEMAYGNARLLARPTAPWLTALVE